MNWEDDIFILRLSPKPPTPTPTSHRPYPHYWRPLHSELGTGEFPAQKASNTENVSIWRLDHMEWAWSEHTFFELTIDTLIGKLGG